ncbi:MAG TPA: zinc ribbon domain-containing protein [Candidatus Limnocylindrales bacterium]|nr:zinc ribbon domain-containing protein [Candidatus Limnocylindrales bacterium]
MPTYDYACRDCGRQVEVLHGVHASGPTACETCGGPMHKLLSAPSIHFKGSGWAKKDRSEASRTKAAAKPDKGAAEKATTPEHKPVEGARTATTTEGATSGAGGSTATGAAGPASAD